LTKKQADGRLTWVDNKLASRPRSYLWKDVAFYDEFHFGIGPQITKRVKRRRGKKARYKPSNVHRKKVTSKDTKAKARGEEPLKLLNVGVIIGYNWWKVIPYEVPNAVGKMTTKVYTEVILPTLKDELLEQGLTLCHDANSAHTSKATKRYCADIWISLITLPGVSPDFSILESMANPIKRKFHAERYATEKAAIARFLRLFDEEMDQKTIQEMYS
jgi:hypothetical protein